ncbi:fumarylacetoacetate hydrolase family protein [Amorphus sp. 3PC139-8]|uniref:fumarylacetoacetate hydrolase family protein n=1 Tax=Amorphus sp. 3PC139-8 TaxID=2735676 RepID=UPI00345C7232
MKFVTFDTASKAARPGAVVNDGAHILDLRRAAELSGASAPGFGSLLELIQAGEAGLEWARTLVSRSPEEALLDAGGVRLLAPLPRPEQIRDFLCFEMHLRQARRQRLQLLASKTADPDQALQRMIDNGQADPPEIWYKQPVYYKGNRFAVVGPDADVEWPDYSDFIDYELELAAVIGRHTRDADRGSAQNAIFGYMIFNDFSARDTQAEEMQGQLGPAKSKDFDTANALGPWLVTADEVPDPYSLQMEARVNGGLWCSENTKTMYHSFEDIIVHVSRSETLYPGEIIGSGTIGGGSAFEIGRRLQVGDRIELSVTGLGSLRNTITRRGAAA